MSAQQWAVILAGGVGSRFWPLSTPQRPKQLLPLIEEGTPLLTATLSRLAPLAPAERTLVLTNAGLVAPIARLAPELPAANIIAEPKPAGTAAALAWAATTIAERAGPDAVMVCVHADWAIGDAPAIVRTLPRAAEMVRDGYLWNSGIFAWRVGDFLDEVRALTPEVAPALDAAGGDIARFFGAVESISVDVGVMERSGRVLVLPGDFGWDDVGTWAALRRVRRQDADGNAASGTVHALQARGNVVHAEGNAVVLYGVEDLVVVTMDGLTVVTTVDKSADLKTLIESLPPGLRDRT